MSSTIDRARLIEAPNGQIPPLEQGDRLTRDEFERRYESMPKVKKAELIEGVVFMPSPTRFHRHGVPASHLIVWLGHYQAATPGTHCAENCTVRLDDTSEVQPDSLLLVDPALGGQTRISEQDYIEGAPEWIGEVASSSVSIDLHAKREVYRRAGVCEYFVWRVLDAALDWWVLRDGVYQPLPVHADGVLRSERFPGLWLDPGALLRHDLKTVLQALQLGLASPEHSAWLSQLESSTP